MEYELDSLGYVLHVYFGCSTEDSIAYSGNVPADYDTLEEWAENADIRAYRIYEGNLVIDNARLQELQTTYDDEHYDYRHVEHRELETLENAIQVINNTVPYDTAEAEGKVVTLTSDMKSQPTIKITDIKPYEYGKVDLYANGKNILPNTAATQEISGLTFKQNEDRSITLNGAAKNKNLFQTSTIEYGNATAANNTTFEVVNNVVTITATGTTGAQYLKTFVKNVDSSKKYTLSFKAKKVVKGTDGGPNIRIYVAGSNDDSTYTYLTAAGNAPTQGVEYSFNITYTGYSYYRFYIYNNTNTPVTIGEQTQYWDIQFEEGNQVSDYEPYKESIEYNLAGTSLNTSPFLVFKKDEDYYLNTILNFKFNMYNFDGTDKTEVYSDSGGAISFSEDEPVTQITLSVPTNVEFEDVTIYPMMAYGSTEQEYEPYKYNKCTIDFSNLIQDGLFPNDDVFPNNDIVPAGTTIDYILINGSEVTINVNGNEESLDTANLNLFEGFNTIYAIQDAYLDITYYLNKLKLEGTTTKNNGFSIDDEGNMSCNNATINGSAIINGSKFSVDEEGNMTCNNATINNATINTIKNYNIAALEFADNATANSLQTSLYTGILELYNFHDIADSQAVVEPQVRLYWDATGDSTTIGAGGCYSPSFTQTSLKEKKKNFEPLENALDIVNDTDIYKYNYTKDNEDAKKHIGFVIGDDFKYREEITSKDNDGADIYSMVSVLWQAVKEQQKEIEELKKQLKGSEK